MLGRATGTPELPDLGRPGILTRDGMPRGRFITFEGGEGAGKSTQLPPPGRAAARPRASSAWLTREPGGTEGAEAIRELIVHGPAERWRPLSELYLFLAARDDHLHRAILPALDARRAGCSATASPIRAGSTRAIAGGLGLELVDALQAPLLAGHRPDLTLAARPAGRDRPGALRRARGAWPASRPRAAPTTSGCAQGFLAAGRAGAGAVRRDRCRPGEDEVAAAVWQAVSDRFGLTDAMSEPLPPQANPHLFGHDARRGGARCAR